MFLIEKAWKKLFTSHFDCTISLLGFIFFPKSVERRRRLESKNLPADMAPRQLFVSSLLLLLCCAVAGSVFDDSNPIRMVSDRLRDLESEVVRVLGQTSHALRFARFAHRFVRSCLRGRFLIVSFVFLLTRASCGLIQVWQEVWDCGGDEAPIRNFLGEFGAD